MNYFIQHIEYLLLRHDCVIVPGLGAFIAISSPARFDISTGEIMPPSRSIMFNQAITSDDGMLANSLARKAAISFEEGRLSLTRYVAMLKECLRENSTVKLGNLGSLQLGEEGNIIFSPSDSSISNSGKTGFTKISVSKSHPKEETAPAITESDYEEHDEDNSYYNLRINKTFVKVAASLIIILSVAIGMFLYPIPHDSMPQKASVVPVDVILPSVSKENAASDTLAVASVLEDETVSVEDSISRLPKFYLIVATFSGEKEAETYARKYSDDTYTLSPIKSGKMTRVSVACSDDHDELQKRLNSREISSRFPSSWIWSRN